TEQINFGESYIIGELENHENLRRLIANVKIQLKEIEIKIQEKLRSKSTSSTGEPSMEWLEHRLKSLNQCLVLLEQMYQLTESYWKTNLSMNSNYDEHMSNDSRLINEV
ncbi:unnamed protein product, partial [Adineta steineri]